VHIIITYREQKTRVVNGGEGNRKHTQAGGKAMLVSSLKRIPEKGDTHEQC